MKTKQEHTATPLEIYGVTKNESGEKISVLLPAEFNSEIHRACNAYDKNQETIKALVEACKEADTWIKDAFKMMAHKGYGWTDASDSLRIALRKLETALQKAGVK